MTTSLQAGFAEMARRAAYVQGEARERHDRAVAAMLTNRPGNRVLWDAYGPVTRQTLVHEAVYRAIRG